MVMGSFVSNYKCVSEACSSWCSRSFQRCSMGPCSELCAGHLSTSTAILIVGF